MHALLALVVLSAVSHAAPRTREWSRYDDLIVAHSLQNGLDPKLVKAVIAVESQFLPQAVSPVGARGLMQLMPQTATEVGVASHRLHDPNANIAAGTAYLAVLFRAALIRARVKGLRFRDAPASVVRVVVAAYNCGPSCLSADRPWPRETQLYVKRVLELYGSPDTAVARVEEAPPLVAETGSGR